MQSIEPQVRRKKIILTFLTVFALFVLINHVSYTNWHLLYYRLERLLTWAGDVDVRLERMTTQGFADAGQALRRLETEIQAETILRKREVDWLNKTGEELLAVEDHGSKRANQLESDLSKLKEIWGNVLSNTDARAAKLRAIIQVLISENNLVVTKL